MNYSIGLYRFITGEREVIHLFIGEDCCRFSWWQNCILNTNDDIRITASAGSVLTDMTLYNGNKLSVGWTVWGTKCA
jgi:hypothetical protein